MLDIIEPGLENKRNETVFFSKTMFFNFFLQK